ncbi:plasma protease C1 inhibitor [Discoglossus pictus]
MHLFTSAICLIFTFAFVTSDGIKNIYNVTREQPENSASLEYHDAIQCPVVKPTSASDSKVYQDPKEACKHGKERDYEKSSKTDIDEEREIPKIKQDVVKQVETTEKLKEDIYESVKVPEGSGTDPPIHMTDLETRQIDGLSEEIYIVSEVECKETAKEISCGKKEDITKLKVDKIEEIGPSKVEETSFLIEVRNGSVNVSDDKTGIVIELEVKNVTINESTKNVTINESTTFFTRNESTNMTKEPLSSEDKNKISQNQEEVTEPPSEPPCLFWPQCSMDRLNNTIGEMTEALTSFSLEIYKEVSKRDSRPNLVIAPFSIALTLSHLMLGSGRQFRDHMLDTLYKGLSNYHCVHEGIRNLTKIYSFLSASEFFFTKDIQINDGFLNQSLQYYGSHGLPLGENNKRNVKLINKWVSKNTGNHIKTLIEELPSDLQLLLVNVVFYQGKWISRFDPKLTKKDVFFTPSSSAVKVPMMNSNKYPLQIIRDTYLKAQVARFRLSHDFSLLLFVPNARDPNALVNVEKSLTPTVLDIVITNLLEAPERAVSVSMPRLKLDSDYGLIETLSLLGFDQIFDSPDLCALSTKPDLIVNDVHHRAVLEVQEDGVTAAAATAITLARTVTVFTVKRPFFFILINDKNRMPYVLGRVTDPSQ